MRATPGASIDPREAYLESVVLFVPGDPQGVEVETDQLEVQGILVTPRDDSKQAANESPPMCRVPVWPRRPDRQLLEQRSRMTASRAAVNSSPVRIQGTTLMVEGKPFSPRVIQSNGEPLKFLSERGFNVVQLASPPTPQQIADAQRDALWFMCTPPRPEALARRESWRSGRPSSRLVFG